MKAFTFTVPVLNSADVSCERAVELPRSRGRTEISPSASRSYTEGSLKRVGIF